MPISSIPVIQKRVALHTEFAFETKAHSYSHNILSIAFDAVVGHLILRSCALYSNNNNNNNNNNSILIAPNQELELSSLLFWLRQRERDN